MTTPVITVSPLVYRLGSKTGFANWVRIWSQTAILLSCSNPPGPALEAFFTLSASLFENLVPFGPSVAALLRPLPSEQKRSAYLRVILDVLKVHNVVVVPDKDVFKFYYVSAVSERVELSSQPLVSNTAPDHPLFTGLPFGSVKWDVPCFTTSGTKVTVPLTKLSHLVDLDAVDCLPTTPASWGPLIWCLLFFVSFHGRDHDFCRRWISCLFDLLPCGICRSHAQSYLREHPLTSTDPTVFLMGLHNVIRTRKDQPARRRRDVELMINEFFVRSSKLTGVHGVTHLSIQYRLHRGLQFLWR